MCPSRRATTPRRAGLRLTQAAALVAGCGLLAPGCTATVLHDHLLGKERRLTIEWTRDAAWPLKPLALVGGVASDGLLGAASIGLWPFDLLGIAALGGWGTWQQGCRGAWWAAPVFPLATAAILPFAVFGEREGPVVVTSWFPPRRDADEAARSSETE